MSSDFIWLNKDGSIVSNVGYSHIDSITNEPELFDTTNKKILDTYRKYKEKTGTEGKARDEIMITAMKKGWIRIRNNNGRWIFETWNLTEEQKNTIFNYILLTKTIHKYDEIIITQVKNNIIERFEDKKDFKNNFII